MEKEDYNKIPMSVCKHCLWPGNPEMTSFGDIDISFCPCCGSTDFIDMSVDEFESQFEKTYKQGRYLKIKHGKLKGVALWKQIMKTDPQTL